VAPTLYIDVIAIRSRVCEQALKSEYRLGAYRRCWRQMHPHNGSLRRTSIVVFLTGAQRRLSRGCDEKLSRHF
jgi:hypothetical protein